MSGPIDELKKAGINDSLIDTIVNFVNDQQEMQAKKQTKTTERKRAAEDVNVGSGKKAKKICGVRGCNTPVHKADRDKSLCYQHMKAEYKLKPCTMMIPKLDPSGHPMLDDNGVVITEPCKFQGRFAGGKCKRCAGGAESIKASRKCTMCGVVTLVRSGLKCGRCQATTGWSDEWGAILRAREERDEEERRAREEE